MNDIAPHIRVVAAVIEQQGRYLITQRRSTAVLAGLWEFPSGRVELGESDEVALQREMRERVGVDVDVGLSTAHRTHRYDGYVVDLVLYRATIAATQEPRPVGVADLRWVAPLELENYAFPPADQATADLLFGTNRAACLSKPMQTQDLRAQVQKPMVHYRLGDSTAKRAGRLTLNPLAHVDPIGTVVLPIVMLVLSGGSYFFGWAKPVPIDPRNFRDERTGMLLTGIAGPAMNVVLALVAGLVSRAFPAAVFAPGQFTSIGSLLLFFCYANLVLAFFNLIPIPPLDGSRIVEWFLRHPDRRDLDDPWTFRRVPGNDSRPHIRPADWSAIAIRSPASSFCAGTH